MVQDFRPARGVSGVYVIVHVPSGKSYIGSAGNIGERWYTHRGSARRGCHTNRRFQEAWSTFGEDAFRFLIVERVPNVADLRARELEWLTEGETWKPENGFNLSRRSDTVGFKFTPEQRAKVSAALKGKPKSAEHRAAMSRRWQEMSPEQQEAVRQRMAAVGRSGKGKRKKKAHSRKIGLAQRGSLNHWAKLTDAAVLEIHWHLALGDKSNTEIGRMYGIADATVSNIASGRVWSHVTGRKRAPVRPPRGKLVTPEMPSRPASKADWVAWAVRNGASKSEAEAMRKSDLIAKYG